MIKIHSLSGGKTSSYMAVHYPADYNIFALVTIEDNKCAPKDAGIIKYVSDKIGQDFIATAEDDTTLYAMRDLEQMLGKEIIWVVGRSFDQLIIHKSGYLPNAKTRFCTTEMKMRPIFDWWYKNIREKIKMGVGYRYDEMERSERFTNKFYGIVGKRKTRNRWEEVEWREGWFPLIDNKIIHPTVVKWAINSGIKYPNDSNCIGCFHKSPQQLRKNFDDNPDKFQWFCYQENTNKNTFKTNIKYNEIKNIPLQTDFDFGGGAGCNAGFCTD